MEDLSNLGVIGTFITILLTVIPTIWGMYKNSEANRQKQMVQSQKELLQSKDENIKVQKEAYEQQIQSLKEFFEQQLKYQQRLIDELIADEKDLQSRYFDLASTIQPALSYTNKALDDMRKIVQKIITNNG